MIHEPKALAEWVPGRPLTQRASLDAPTEATDDYARPQSAGSIQSGGSAISADFYTKLTNRRPSPDRPTIRLNL
jgi:hypothetical protein